MTVSQVPILCVKFISSLKKKTLIKKIQAKREPVYLCVEDEINTWYILINELCCGIYLSNEFKDTSIIQYAAINVFLIDAVYMSGLDRQAYHSKDLEKSLAFLRYYTLLKEDKNRRSSDAKQILNLRIKPSGRDIISQRLNILL
jgi:hypothetical protein